MSETIFELIAHNGWDKVFFIEEPAYRELILEVLITIEIIKPSRVTFQAFGEMNVMSNIKLGCYLVFYDAEFMNRSFSHHLPVDFPAKMTHQVLEHSFGWKDERI